jgi:lipooligosaccharide transport system permease protein
LTVEDLIFGHLGWVGIRVLMTAVVYAGVLFVFGALDFASGLATLLPALLTGMAFAAPITALTARMQQETGLSTLFRFGIVPLFLFSGTFFPIDQLPDWLQPVAYLTPLWHGVELCRGAAGVPDSPYFPPWIHIAYLLLWIAVGTFLAVRQLRRRMVK